LVAFYTRVQIRAKRELRMFLEEDSNSQAGQESFVLNVFNRKKEGSYIEIGSFHAKDLSNTYLLESRYKWKGIGFEISPERVAEYSKSRINQIICTDATKCDYENIFDSYGMPNTIDYLQVDIEPAKNSFKALMMVLRTSYDFGVITFEHDIYVSRSNYIYKIMAFIMLRVRGYRRVGSNISNEGNPYEDWYINKSINYKKTFDKNSEWQSLFKS
jgi:hypothetical protein